jgi:hypothetical protein
VASVEGTVITLSQLEFEARVLLVQAGGVEAAFVPLDHAALASSLDLIIDQRLATLEADKLGTYPLEPGDLDKAIASFRDRFSSEIRFRQFLDSQEADLNDVALVLRRSLRAQRVLDGKLRLRAQVPESDARRIQAQRPEFAGMPLQSVRQALFAERFRELVREDLEQTRKAADVRLLGPFARSGSPVP